MLAHEEGTNLATALSRCDFAIHAPQHPPSPALRDVRLTLVNEEYAAAAMTPRLLAGFRGRRRWLPTGPRPEVEGEDKYASVAGKADRVLVLTRALAQ